MSLTLEDKNVRLQSEIQRLKKSLRKLGEASDYWRELALEYQAERDCLKEQKAQEGSDRE